MIVGTACVEITPRPGIDLTGFAVRSQPATSVLDPLWIRALFLEDRGERLLWLHADLLALEQSLADRLRQWVHHELNIPVSRVLVATTHTHSGPAAISLTGCGHVDTAYLAWLEGQFHQAAHSALQKLEPCQLIATQGHCELGVDRRAFASAHTDPRVGVLAWRREDGTYKAVFLDYAMHPVCLREPLISADWPGEAARVLSAALPGEPMVLVSPGACGNVNPPAVGVPPSQMRQWGAQVAERAFKGLLAPVTPPLFCPAGSLKIATKMIALPIEEWDARGIEQYAGACLADPAGEQEFGDHFRLAVDTWRATMLNRVHRAEPAHFPVELTAAFFGQAAILTINAEIFSRFTELAHASNGCPVYTVSCANGMIGYVPCAEAYDEGAYEVNWAMLFYNRPRARRGGLELLAAQARALLAGLTG